MSESPESTDQEPAQGPASEELVEQLDAHGAVVAVVSRAEMRARNYWHRNIIVLLQRSSGHVVVHQRAGWKDLFPSYWDVVFGGVPAVGESDRAAAIRELAEEAGLVVNSDDLVDLGLRVWEGPGLRWHGRLFLISDDRRLAPVDGEVVAVAEVPLGELGAWMERRPVCPDSKSVVGALLAGGPTSGSTG